MWLVVALLAVVVAMPLWWSLFDPLDDIETDRLISIRVLRTTGGGVSLAIEREICSARTFDAYIRTRLVGPVVVSLGEVYRTVPEGCVTAARQRDLPWFPDGAYVWETHVVACNPMKCRARLLAPFEVRVSDREASVETLPPGRWPPQGPTPLPGSGR